MAHAIDWDTIMTAIHTWIVAVTELDPTLVLWSFQGQPQARPFIELELNDVAQVAHDWTRTERNPLTFDDITIESVDTAADTLTATAHTLKTGDGPVHIVAEGVGALPPTPLQPDTDYWLIRDDANTLQVARSFFDAMGDPVKLPIGLDDEGTPTIKIVATSETERQGIELKRTAEGIREITLRIRMFAKEKSGNEALKVVTDIVSSLALHVYELDLAGFGVSDLGNAGLFSRAQLLEGQRGGILEPQATVSFTGYVASSLSDYITYIQRVRLKATLKAPGGAPLTDTDMEIST